MPATCQLSGHHVGKQEPWLTVRQVGMHSQSMEDLSTTTPANALAWHSSEMPGKAMQDQANAQFLVGKEKPSDVDLSKGKSVEEVPWKWPFHKIPERTFGSKNLSQSLQPSPLPSALTCHLI